VKKVVEGNKQQQSHTNIVLIYAACRMLFESTAKGVLVPLITMTLNSENIISGKLTLYWMGF